MRRILALMMVVAIGGCTLDQQGAPPLAGPSGLGLTLAVTATPDILPQDGSSKSVIQMVATDSSDQPVVGLGLKTEVVINGVIQDAVTVTTGSDGKASVTFFAPGFLGGERIATIRVTPIGSNYGNSQARFALIRLSVL